MGQDTQHEIWNPFCERVDGLSASERADMEISRAWAYYARGGGGDPSYFDPMSHTRMLERQRER
jgi:hypothetical protein